MITKKRINTRKKSTIRPLVVVMYGGVFAAIVAVVAVGSKLPDSASSVASVNSVESALDKDTRQHASVNEVVATTVAANIAEAANLPVARNVANLSISLAIEKDMAASNSSESVTKQEIVQPSGSRRELITHTTKTGETVSRVAEEYGVSKDTIMWANDLTSDKLQANKKLVIPPVDGVVYEVKAGDTINKLAKKYKTNEARIVAFNDLELSGLTKGKKIIIPAGTLPETERPGYTAPTIASSGSGPSSSSPSSTVSAGFTYTPGSVGNRYAYGWCTWYAYERRPEIGSFWGDARNWAYSASRAGFTVVQGVPKAGAIFQYGGGGFGGGYGHVGIVESVDLAKGTMVISDMNGIAGWGAVGRDTVPINKSWNYIY